MDIIIDERSMTNYDRFLGYRIRKYTFRMYSFLLTSYIIFINLEYKVLTGNDR